MQQQGMDEFVDKEKLKLREISRKRARPESEKQGEKGEKVEWEEAGVAVMR